MWDLSQVASRELWTTDDINGNAELTRILDSGVIIRDPRIKQKVQSNDMGTILSIPFVQEADYREPNISDDSNDAPDELSISKSSFLALLGNYNTSFTAFDIARMVDSGMDAFMAIQSLSGKYWASDIQHRMVSTAVGVMNANIANDSSDLVIDTPTTLFSADGLDDAKQLRGDAGWNGNEFIFVSSKGFRAMKKRSPNSITAVRAEDGFTVLYWLWDESTQIVIDDGVKDPAATSATIILADQGAYVFEETTDVIEPIEYIRDGKAGNGGGKESVITRKRYMIHPQGYSFDATGLNIETGATLAEIEDSDRWERKVKTKQSKFTFYNFKV